MAHAALDLAQAASSTATRSPEELAVAARNGDRSAFEALVARYERPLFGFLVVRLGDPDLAEEATHEAFLRAWTKLALYDERHRFSTWLFTLAKNHAVSLLRGRKHPRGSSPALEELGVDVDPARRASEQETRSRLWTLARRVLSEESRSALWLRYGEDQSIPEIARILERREVTVRVLLFRARATLARHLEASERTPAAASRARLLPTSGGPT